MKNPLISIVTVVLDDIAGLSATARSVLLQTYPNIEFVVKDGESKDGCEAFDERFGRGNVVNTFASTKDSGIFDAMNQGVALATGDYILFLNAGDLFASPTALSELVAHVEPEAILTSQSIASETGKIHNFPPHDRFWMGNTFDHQSVLTPRRLLEECPFDDSLALMADLDFFSKMRVSKQIFKHVDVVSVKKPYQRGATSNYFTRFDERLSVLLRHFGGAYPVQRELEAEYKRKIGPADSSADR